MQSELEKVAWFQYFALLLIKKKTKFCKQQKIGEFEYFGDSDVVNKLIVQIARKFPACENVNKKIAELSNSPVKLVVCIKWKSKLSAFIS